MRREDVSCPPVAGSRLSSHDIDLGVLEQAGRFTIELTLTGQRVLTSKTVDLEMPPVEHPPLWFMVRPGAAIAPQSKVWLLSPDGAAHAHLAVRPQDFWEEAASVLDPHSGDADEAAFREASGEREDGEPLTVEAGEVARVRVLTRDKYLNPSSEKAKNVTGELKLLEKAEGAKVMPVANSNTLSRDPNAQPSRYDQCLARYKGSGIHEVDFVREIAGRYEAGATLRDERVMSKGGGEHGLTLIVAPTAVEPTMCTCRELRGIVDPGAIGGARGERIRAQQEHERRQQGEGETGLSLGASHWCARVRTRGVTGTMEITTYDRFAPLRWHGL